MESSSSSSSNICPPAVEAGTDEPAQGVATVNADNLLAARRPTSMTNDSSTFTTLAKV